MGDKQLLQGVDDPAQVRLVLVVVKLPLSVQHVVHGHQVILRGDKESSNDRATREIECPEVVIIYLSVRITLCRTGILTTDCWTEWHQVADVSTMLNHCRPVSIPKANYQNWGESPELNSTLWISATELKKKRLD